MISLSYHQAIKEEETVNERGTSKVVYLNVAVGAMQRIRKETLASTSRNKKIITHPLTLSHEAVLGGKRALNTSYTIKRSGKPLCLQKADLTGMAILWKIYMILK